MVFTIFFVIVIFNIRKRKENIFSILSRIFTNYIHCFTVSLSYNLTYPSIVSDSLSPAKEIGSSSDTVVSFDCFIEDFKMNFFGSSEFIMKSFLSCFTPIAFVLMFAGVWVIWKLIRRNQVDLWRYIVVSLITILLFFHPTLTEKTLSLFKCVGIDDDTRLIYDLELICWEGTHLKWALFYWAPMFLGWVIGIPVIAVVFLSIKRKSVHSRSFNKYFLVLYQGL